MLPGKPLRELIRVRLIERVEHIFKDGAAPGLLAAR